MRRTRTSAKAPTPIKMTVNRLDPDGLRQAYEWMTVDRAASLRLALDWYNANLTTLLHGDPLDAERQKSYERGVKSAAIGEHTTFEGEREAAWTMALRMYEKTWPGKGLPTVGEAVQAADLGSMHTHRVTNAQTVLSNLNAAFAGSVTFRMTFGYEREFDGETVALPLSDIMAMVPMTPLKSALREAPTAAKVLSVVADPETGERSLDGARFMETLPTLMDKVADWAAMNDVSRKAVGRAAASKPQATTTRNAGMKPRNTTPINANRLPPPNSIIIHVWKGRTLRVEVLTKGFLYDGKQYGSLSRIACVITGYKTCNGFDFFKLNGKA